MRFEWDEDKRLANIRKHGIDFAEAIEIWNSDVLDPAATRRVAAELRLLALGMLQTDATVIAVVYTHRDGVRRIISARRARRNERKNYQATLGRGG